MRILFVLALIGMGLNAAYQDSFVKIHGQSLISQNYEIMAHNDRKIEAYKQRLGK
jgi:hypothetical protein